MKKITLNVMNLNYHGRNHAECADPAYLEYLIFLIIVKFLYVLISLSPDSPSRVIIKYPFAQNFTTENDYFYVLC